MDPRLAVSLFHDTPDTVAVSFITLRDIPQRFQTGCLSVVGVLPLFEFFILLFHLASQRSDFPLHFPVLHLDTVHLDTDFFVFFLMSLDDLLLLGLVTFQFQHTLAECCFSDPDLLKHRIVTLHLTFC